MTEAMEVLLAALKGGLPLIAMDCPKCGFPHLDIGEPVVKPKQIHQCYKCMEGFNSPVKVVSNPLSMLNPILQGDKIYFGNAGAIFRG